MKIFTTNQIREGDAFTIQTEPVSSIDLMERAANQCARWLLENFDSETPFYIFCGVGNNGGDGLALTRILQEHGQNAQAYIVCYSNHFSKDCKINRERLEHTVGSHLQDIHTPEDFPGISENVVIIDALFGTGLNRPLTGLAEGIVNQINDTKNTVVSIDIPSGLQAEDNFIKTPIIRAVHTLSFEFYKLAFLFPENAVYTGQVHILPIHIHPEYIRQTSSPFHLITQKFVHQHLIGRKPFSHKGTYGHAMLIAGSYGKTGAAVLSAKAAIHSGLGLLTTYIPESSYAIMQTAVPEAMCICDNESIHSATFTQEMKKCKVLGIGPGIGTGENIHLLLKSILETYQLPMVIDADALNLIGKNPSLFSLIPQNSILTPHPKEFERLFGKTKNSYKRLQLQIAESKKLQVTILLKGHYTCITTPSGEAWFNSTGNAGMATGGSGDVLTGILTALLAQGYETAVAAIIGAWLHGKAGDLALEKESMESLTASSIIDYLGKAFNSAR